MDFDDDSRLDTSQVQDARGGIGAGGGIAIGGGAIGLVALVIALLTGADPAKLLGGGQGGVQPVRPTSDLAAQCRTGADADQSEDCRVVGVVNSIQRYWKDAFAERGKGDYINAQTVLFSQVIDTGCGRATSEVGPFYCPADKNVYLDLSFFEELKSRFGARGGPFAQAYVIAHEYGHHVQDLIGTMNRVRGGKTGPKSASVRLELQADCYAGVWAKNAVETKFFAKPFSRTDIEAALSAAAAVGDDRIQEKVRGRVDPESFTHGTAGQRVKWFTTGYETGAPARCNTFSGDI